MTRIFATGRLWLSRFGRSQGRMGRPIFQLALLSSLLLVAGCEGSRLGDSLGDRLEPDPQLADNPNGLAGDADSEANGENNSDQPPKESSDEPKTENKPSASATEEKPEDSAANKPDPPKLSAAGYTDLAKAPEEIQSYLVDMLELDVLEVSPPVAAPAPAPTSNEEDPDGENGEDAEGESAAQAPSPAPAPPGPNEFRPNQAITRREYARWLLAVNNLFYEGERDRRIRPGVTSSQPVFTDVPISDP
ncbi:MAG: hypothetical protein AAFU53_20760, partial [Cyanobacteria bacterium J06632_3]